VSDSEEDRLQTPSEIAEVAASASTSPFSSRKRLERARELLRAIAVASTNASLYPASHPTLVQSIDDVGAAVRGVTDLGLEEVTINVYMRTLFVEDHVLPEESATYGKLIDDLLARGVSAVTISDDFTRVDAEAFTSLLVADGIGGIEDAQSYLDAHGARSIVVAETAMLEDESKSERAKESKARARKTYEGGAAAMRHVEASAKLGKVSDIAPLKTLVNGLLGQLFTDPAAVLGLTAIKGHDDYSLNHAVNVCVLALSLGATLVLDAESLKSLGMSALLYDLGKVRIPEDILTKQNPLTAEEWQTIKTHAEEGADLLKGIQLEDQMPMVVAYEHHQRYDLQGYPESADGQEQHLFSRIVAVCDAYDAMTTSRPFRNEIRPDKALAVLMQGRGKAYDPEITKVFVAMLGIYPMGAIVKLTDDSIAVVFRVNRDELLRPRVKILVDPEGRRLDDPTVLDLRINDPKVGEIGIVEALPAGEVGIDDVWDYL
jgi:HD-GYP domain-containing protein (c-di-GMP phosphodiesterase class II)